MFWRFLCCLLSTLKHSESFRFEQIETVFVLLDEFRLLRGSLLLRLEPHAVGNEVFNSVEGTVSSRIQSNSCSSFVSVATVLVTCSCSSSFSWHHGFGQLSLLFFNHADPFSHTDSLRPSMDIPRVPMLSGFSIPLTCLHWSNDEFSSISAALFATNTCCFLWAACSHNGTVHELVQW